jgi:hypothetical protein
MPQVNGKWPLWSLNRLNTVGAICPILLTSRTGPWTCSGGVWGACPPGKKAGSGEVEQSIMEAYNIGENLEFLHLDSDSERKHEVILRTPKLKALRMNDDFHNFS